MPKAKNFAMDWYDEISYLQRNGSPVHDRTFVLVTKEYLEYQKTLVLNYLKTKESGSVKKTGRITGKYRTERQAKDYTYRINALNKFFSSHGIGGGEFNCEVQQLVKFSF